MIYNRSHFRDALKALLMDYTEIFTFSFLLLNKGVYLSLVRTVLISVIHGCQCVVCK